MEICLAFLRRYLSGFQGYPRNIAGENRFAEALQANAISVEHLEEILKTFDEDFPTVRQIHDVAMNLRPRFEPPVALAEKWEQEYGKPQPFDRYPADEMAMHWQAFRDILYYTEGPAKDMKSPKYWDEALRRALDPEIGNHADSIAFIRGQAREMGWPAIMALQTSPVPFPYKNPLHSKRGHPVKGFVQGPRITQADIAKAEQAHRKTTEEVDREMDSSGSEGWDDPDR